MDRLMSLCLTFPLLVAAGCGGGTNDTPATPVEPYTFVWTGVVSQITDGFGVDAVHTEVAVGDTYSVRLDYDPALFTDLGPTADGREYAAHEGARLVYLFQSGYVVERPIAIVRARENGGKGQWNWKGPGGSLWFQANEAAGSSFGGVFPADFEAIHEVFAANMDSFVPASGNGLDEAADDPADERSIRFDEQAVAILLN